MRSRGEYSYLLAHSLSVPNGQIWARPNPGTGNSIQISPMDDNGPTTGSITAVSQGLHWQHIGVKGGTQVF